ncbi:MAG: phosphopantetheine-binding protein [Vicinamibacterales bacterium]
MGREDDDRLLRRLDALSPERRAMLEALLDEPIEAASSERPASPRELTAAEESLLAIWEQVLGISGIGIHDDFFEIGGDSISAMRVAAKAQRAGVPITVRDLVTKPTIAALASLTNGRRGECASRESRRMPLTPAQWQVARPGFWHRGSMAGAVSARVERAGIRAIPAVLDAIVRRHDALRLSLRQSPAGWELVESAPVQVPLVDLTALAGRDGQPGVERLTRQLATVLGDPDHPLCRSISWQAGCDAGLALACHRWCADSESIEILRQETSHSLRAWLEGRPARLSEAPEFSACAAEQTGGTDRDRDDEEPSGRLYDVRGMIQRDVTLPPSWRPAEATGTPNPLERMALAALARSHEPEAREVRVMLWANARTAPELRDAVGYYVQPMALVVAGRPTALRPARPDESMEPSALGVTCFFRQPLEPARPADRERWTTSARPAGVPFWSRQPLDIHNEAEPGRWRTVWRFDEAVHEKDVLQEQCDRFLGEIAGMAAGRGPDPGALSEAFTEADLSADELERLFAG